MNILKRLFGKKEVNKTDSSDLFIGSTITVPKTWDIPWSSYKAHDETLKSMFKLASKKKTDVLIMNKIIIKSNLQVI